MYICSPIFWHSNTCSVSQEATQVFCSFSMHHRYSLDSLRLKDPCFILRALNVLPNYSSLGLKNKFHWGVTKVYRLPLSLYTYLKWPKQETQFLLLQISLILHLYFIPYLNLLPVQQIFSSRMMQGNDESE